jgi:hypothetical protein
LATRRRQQSEILIFVARIIVSAWEWK